MRIKGRIIGIQLIFLFLVVVNCYAQRSILLDNNELKDNQVNILMIFDNPYGAEYNYTRKVLEDRFGWSVTTTALTETIGACQGLQPLVVDYTIDNLPSLSNYDIISIMPGKVHENLMASQEVLELVRDAKEEGLIVSAWCKGVRVLATADVINGTRITGQWEYKSEYLAAGAIYVEFSEPIIDGNIVTCQSSSQYRIEMCCALAEAVGVIEKDPPNIISPFVTQMNQNNYSVTANITDVTGVFSVQAKLYLLSPHGERASIYPAFTVALEETETMGVYSSIFEINDEQYSIDIEAEDIYYNLKTLTDLAVIGEPSETSLTKISFLIIPTSSFLIVVILYSIKKRK